MSSSSWGQRFRLDEAFRSRYELLEALGRGAMGEVVKARQLAVGRTVAVKFLVPQFFEDADGLRRFRDEATIMARLNHPNIVQVITFEGDAPVPYLVLEFVDGASLRRLVESEGPLPVGRALEILEALAQGLGQAHESKIIHRDLKSENVLIGRDGLPKIVDFGLAKLTEGRGDQTASGVILGTPEYMSPEQIRGDELDGRTDIYSAGVILYEMLTGHVPFRNDAVSRVLLDQLETPPPMLREVDADLPPELDELVRRALAKDRLARFRSAEALLLAVQGTRRSLERQKLLAVRADPGGKAGRTQALPARRGAPGGAAYQTQATARDAAPARAPGRPAGGGLVAAALAEPAGPGVPPLLLGLVLGTLLLGAMTLAWRFTRGAPRVEGEVRAEALAAQKHEEIDTQLAAWLEEGGADPARGVFVAETVARYLGDPAAAARARQALLDMLEATRAPEVVRAAGLPLVEAGVPDAFAAVLGLLAEADAASRAGFEEALVQGMRKARGGSNRFLRDPDRCRELCRSLAGLLQERFGGRYPPAERARLIQLYGDCARDKELQEAMLAFASQERFGRPEYASPEEFSMLGRLAREAPFQALRELMDRHFFHTGSKVYVALSADRLEALKQGLGRR